MTPTIDQIAYQELKKAAAFYMSKERANHTLCPTALVNEAFLKYQKCHRPASDKPSFLVVAARNMRQILVNHALARNALKRGGSKPTVMSLDEQLVVKQTEIDILELDDALHRLEAFDETKARIVELRYFSGMTNEEIAAELAISVSTIKRKWIAARAWLYREMS